MNKVFIMCNMERRLRVMAKRYKLKSVIILSIETDLEDVEIPSSETIKFLIEEDLQDLGYGINYSKVEDFEMEEMDNYV